MPIPSISQGIPDSIVHFSVKSFSESHKEGFRIKKIFTITLTLGLLASQIPAYGEPPVYTDIKDRITFPNECYGRSDKPHLSGHAPGRVNVVARTVCPGQGVLVSSTLVREYGGIIEEKTVSRKAVGLVTISISMKCIWKKGTPLAKYTIRSKHQLTNGRSGETTQFAPLKC